MCSLSLNQHAFNFSNYSFRWLKSHWFLASWCSHLISKGFYSWNNFRSCWWLFNATLNPHHLPPSSILALMTWPNFGMSCSYIWITTIGNNSYFFKWCTDFPLFDAIIMCVMVVSCVHITNIHIYTRDDFKEPYLFKSVKMLVNLTNS